jgi:DNA-binding GntR family transcriptional regulator
VIELDETRPKWRQVAEVIRQRIEDGTYPAGSRVPSVVQLTEEFGIATVTGQKVMRALREEGAIRTELGMGSYVTDGQKT